MNKYTCFVISPIGKEGTDIYQDYKDLLDLIYSGKMTDPKTIAEILAYAQKEGIR